MSNETPRGSQVSHDDLELVPATEAEFDGIGKRLQAAFIAAAREGLGYEGGEPIPSDDDVRGSLRGEGAHVLHIVHRGERVGAVVVSVHEGEDAGSLDFFFIDGAGQNKGLGFRAWQLVEQRYPQVRVWSTATPYFDTRNIHFYVNKCGFKIVEFFHAGHPDPHQADDNLPGNQHDGTAQMFSFEKLM